MESIRKQTVLKEVREKGSWSGYIAPNKARVPSVWNIEMPILIAHGLDGKYYVVNEYSNSPITADFEELETTLNSFKYYNCNSELGKTVRFWK